MKKTVWVWMVAGVLGVAAAGCGVSDDFEAASRLKVLSLEDADGSTSPVFYANEETDDLGRDGEAGTGDQGEGDRFPDSFEAVVTRLSNDLGVLTLENESRLGVDPGVDLVVFQVDVTYLDAFGRGRAFAPTSQQPISKTIAPGDTEELQFTLVPLSMKVTDGGLRDIFLFGTQAEIDSVRNMRAIVDIYARDRLNNDTVHAQAAIGIQFTNPMIAKVAQ